MAISLTIETGKLEAAVRKIVAATGRSLPEVTREAAGFFAQSAARQTPPDAGKARFSRKSLNRPVVTRTDRRGRTRFAVPYRTARKRGVAWFGSRAEAKRFAVVTWRGIGRAGWWASLPAFGVTTTGQPGTSQVHATAARWGLGMMGREFLAPMATIANMAPTVKDSFAQVVAARAMVKTRLRMIGAARAMLAKVGRTF